MHTGRVNNDFGRCFYAGEGYEQAISFISGFEKSSVYFLDFDARNLQYKKYEINQKWMMTIAYYHGVLKSYEVHPVVRKLIESCYISANEKEYYKNIRTEDTKLGDDKVKLRKPWTTNPSCKPIFTKKIYWK